MTASAYALLIDRLLTNCLYLEQRPYFTTKIQIPANNPEFFDWREEIKMIDGYRLKVRDQAQFNSIGMTKRSFSYDFRQEKTGRLVWRICNHHEWQSITHGCHLHVNPTNEDERLEFFSDSKRTDFAYALRCVKNFYERKDQEWEVKNVENL